MKSTHLRLLLDPLSIITISLHPGFEHSPSVIHLAVYANGIPLEDRTVLLYDYKCPSQ